MGQRCVRTVTHTVTDSGPMHACCLTDIIRGSSTELGTRQGMSKWVLNLLSGSSVQYTDTYFTVKRNQKARSIIEKKFSKL